MITAIEAFRVVEPHIPNGYAIKKCWLTEGEYVFLYDDETPGATGYIVSKDGTVGEYVFFPSMNRANPYENLERIENAKRIDIKNLR